jgi:peptidoglycan/LPS O-acetylase OafA/YrhL
MIPQRGSESAPLNLEPIEIGTLPSSIPLTANSGPIAWSLMSILLMPGAFRLLLATAVVVNHYTRLQIGTAAVELFFILSGYWIDRMYDRQYSKLRFPAFVFITSRFMRLMPLFLLFSVIAILLQNALGTKVALDHIGFDMLPNFFILGYASLSERPLVPAWSLDIELQFYLLFPLLWGALSRSRKFLGSVAVALLIGGGLYLGLFLREQSAVVIPYFGFFAVGIYASRIEWKPTGGLIWSGIGIALLGAAMTAVIQGASGIFVASESLPGRAWNTAANVAVAVCLAPLAISTVNRRSTRRDRIAGDLSYAVYCSHWISVVVAAYYFSEAGWRTKLPFIAGALILTYGVSLAALVWFDRPLGQLRERWIRRQPSRAELS